MTDLTPTIPFNGHEEVEGDFGDVQMSIHTRINGNVVLLAEDEYFAAYGREALSYVETINRQLIAIEANARVALIDDIERHDAHPETVHLFTVIPVLSDDEQYALDQMQDARDGWDTEMEIDRESGYTRDPGVE